MTHAGRASDFVENRRNITEKGHARLIGLPEAICDKRRGR